MINVSAAAPAAGIRTALLVLTLLMSGCADPIGERFADVDAIGMSETWRDWVVVGRFGPGGPFEVTDIKRCAVNEPCSFSHEGQGHTYDGFYGYRLTVLRLEDAQGQVSHVILRSAKKYPDDDFRQ